MGKRDKRVDTYIAGAPEFAKPILTRLRDAVHAASPDIDETIKWGSPFFVHAGRPLCFMASFKAHCAFGYWRRSSLLQRTVPESGSSRGEFGRMTALSEAPTRKVIVDRTREAIKLNAVNTGVVRKAKPKAPAVLPKELRAALAGDRKAAAAFEAFSPSHRREYAEWIGEAKQEATRERRVKQAIEWIAKGKHRNWKYEDC